MPPLSSCSLMCSETNIQTLCTQHSAHHQIPTMCLLHLSLDFSSQHPNHQPLHLVLVLSEYVLAELLNWTSQNKYRALEHDIHSRPHLPSVLCYLIPSKPSLAPRGNVYPPHSYIPILTSQCATE